MPRWFKFKKVRDLEGEAIVGLRQVVEDQTGVELQFLNGLARIESFQPGIVRVRVTKDLQWPQKISDAVTAPPASGYALRRKTDALEFSAGETRLVVPEGPFRFEIYDRDDNLLSRDFPGLGPGFGKDEFKVHRHLLPEESLYGLGDKYGPLARRGRAWKFWNRDCATGYEKDPRYTSIPFLISLRPGIFCAWFIDHPGRLTIDAGKTFPGLLSFQGSGADCDLYFLHARSLKELVSLFTRLVGQSFFPPLWALGCQQSRWSYFSQAEIEELVSGFEKRQIPLSAVYMDIHYLDHYKVFTVDEKRFPDLAGMAKRLLEKGVRLVPIIDPGVKAEPGYAPYDKGCDAKVFCADEQGREYHARLWPGECAFPDFFAKEARDYWAQQHEWIFEHGAAGIWNDMNEPSFWKNEIRFRDTVIPLKQVTDPKIVHKVGSQKVRHAECRNLYGQKQCQAAIRAFRKFRPGQRPFILSRSGFAGIQRYAALWTGDNKSSFRHLAASVPQILSQALSGVSLTGADIGGFKKNCSPELFARWVQLGAFYPFCRMHSALGTRAQEPWRFGPEVEEIARKYLRLRCRLLPMIYSLVRQNCETGIPLWRPLIMEFPEDFAARGIEDQVMFGESLMLAPVLKPGAKTRTVYLPRGKWVDFFDRKVHEGPGWTDMPVTLDKMPVLVREGAIMVSQPAPGLKIPWPELEIDLWPGAKASSFQLYEDDGETDAFAREEFSLRELRMQKTGGEVRFAISAPEGRLPIPPRELKIRFQLQHARPQMAIDGKPAESSFDAENQTVELTAPLDNSPHVVSLK